MAMIYNSRNSFGLLACPPMYLTLSNLQQQKFIWLISLLQSTSGGKIYNSRNSFGLLACCVVSCCLTMIYNSRNSFGLLAITVSSFHVRVIYNSRNSFGLLALSPNKVAPFAAIYNSRNSFGLLAYGSDWQELADLQQQKFIWLISHKIGKSRRF